MLYKDMVVWKVAKRIHWEVFDITKRFSRNDLDTLGKQLRRASISVASNIAEGKARPSRKDYARFVAIALASAVEVECQLQLGISCGIIRSDITELLKIVGKEISMLTNLRRKLISPNPL
jgi:four helix bundle protein